nr:hypothetical protein GCM10020093_012680 [Planobispora longispora]
MILGEERGTGVKPSYIPGHGLLRGRVAVVTAAAGTGIGGACARRMLEEGARVVISDAHERRLGRAGPPWRRSSAPARWPRRRAT